MVAGISDDVGLEAYMIVPSSVNRYSFIDFLKLVREANPNGRLAIFMDNLYVHKTKEVQRTMEELDMISIFSVPYSP